MSSDRKKRIQMLEMFSKPQLQRIAKRLFGSSVPRRYSKDDLAKMIQLQGIPNVKHSFHLQDSNAMTERAVYQKIQQQDARIRNLRRQKRDYQAIRPVRGFNNTELLLNSIRARDELIARLQRK